MTGPRTSEDLARTVRGALESLGATMDECLPDEPGACGADGAQHIATYLGTLHTMVNDLADQLRRGDAELYALYLIAAKKTAMEIERRDQAAGESSPGECGKQVFPDHPEWGSIPCNLRSGHDNPCARFEPVSGIPFHQGPAPT